MAFDKFENGNILDILAIHQIAIRNSDDSACVWLCNALTTLSVDMFDQQEVKVADLEFSADMSSAARIRIVGEDSNHFVLKKHSLYSRSVQQEQGVSPGFLNISLVVDWPENAAQESVFLTHTLSVFAKGEIPRLLLADAVQSISFDGSEVSGSKIADLVLSNNISASDLCLVGPDADKFQIEGNKVFVNNAMFNEKPLLSDIVLIIAVQQPQRTYEAEQQTLQTSPVLMSIESYPLMYVETQAAVSVSDTLLALSPGSGIISSASVSIIEGYDQGNDFLVMVNESDSSDNVENKEHLDQFVDFDSQRGILRIVGSGSVAEYVSLLRSIKFFNAGEEADGVTRSIEIAIEDAGICSNVLQRELFVVPAKYSADYTDSANQFNDSVYIEDFESLVLDQKLLLGILKNNVSESMQLDDTSVFQITEPPPGIEIFVDNESESTFTLADVNRHSVILKHDGSSRKGGTLFMEVDNGDDAIFAMTLHVLVYAEGKRNSSVANWGIEGTQFCSIDIRGAGEGQDELIDYRKSAANMEFPTSENGFDSENKNNKHSIDSTKKTGTTIAPVRSERKHMMYWNKSMFQDTLPSNLELLASLQLPNLPAKVHIYQKIPAIYDLAEMIVQHTGGSPESMEYRSELLTTLLELNPLVLSVDAHLWSDWFSRNQLFSKTTDEYRRNFEDCAASLLGGENTQSVVTSHNAGEVSVEFVAWLLSSGHLLSVLQTHPDLYSRAA